MPRVRIAPEIYAASFVSGFAVMGIEILASRLIAPAVGTSVLVWTNLIGVVLLSLAAGAWVGGIVADKRPDRRILGGLLFTGGVLASFLTFAYDLATWLIGWLPEGAAVPVLALLLLTPAALILGAVSPVAVRLALHELGDAGHIAGRLSAIGTVGSLAGTYLTGYVFIAIWPTHWILAVITIILYATGLWILRPAFPKQVAAGCLAAGALFAGQTADGPPGTFIPSAYSSMRIGTSTYLGTPVKILWMDRVAHGGTTLADPSRSFFPYYDLFQDFTDLLTPNAKTFLAIGGGTFHGARAWIDSAPGRTATVIERDPAAITASKTYFDLKDDPRLTILEGDGRAALTPRTERYDVVMLDAYADHLTVPWHLVTVEAWANLRAHVTDDALVAMNFILHEDLERDANARLMSGIIGAAKTQFRYAKLARIDDKDDAEDLTNTLLLLSNVREPSDDEIRAILDRNDVLREPAVYPIVTHAHPPFTDRYAPVEYLSTQLVH